MALFIAFLFVLFLKQCLFILPMLNLNLRPSSLSLLSHIQQQLQNMLIPTVKLIEDTQKMH